MISFIRNKKAREELSTVLSRASSVALSGSAVAVASSVESYIISSKSLCLRRSENVESYFVGFILRSCFFGVFVSKMILEGDWHGCSQEWGYEQGEGCPALDPSSLSLFALLRTLQRFSSVLPCCQILSWEQFNFSTSLHDISVVLCFYSKLLLQEVLSIRCYYISNADILIWWYFVTTIILIFCFEYVYIYFNQYLLLYKYIYKSRWIYIM